MTIVYDAVTTFAGKVDDPFSLSHSASGSDRMAVVIVAAIRNQEASWTFSDVTYGGVSMSFESGDGFSPGTGRYLRIEVWTAGNVPTGSQTVAVAHEGSTLLSKSLACTTYTGVSDIGDADSANGTGTATSVTLTTTVTDAVVVGGVAAFEQSGGGTITTGTERWDFESEGDYAIDDHRAMGGHMPAASAGDHDFDYTITTSDDWGTVAVELQPSSGGSARAKQRFIKQGTRFGVRSGM